MALQRSQLWPVRPKLQPEESFSSWFWRLAVGNGTYPAALYRALIPGARLFDVDMDRHADQAIFDALELRTGQPGQAIAASTFRAWEGLLFDVDDGRRKLPWLAPAGQDGNRSAFGQQICPACMRDDDVPFARKQWRLQYVTICPRHQASLLDRCTSCAAPFHLTKNRTAYRVPCCWSCGMSLSKLPRGAEIDLNDLVVQEELLAVAESGWVEFGHYGPIYSISYFEILERVVRLLATGRFAKPLRQWVIVNQPKFGLPDDVPRLKEAAQYNPRCRRMLIRMSMSLLWDWPKSFVSACSFVGLFRGSLLKSQEPAPYAFWSVVTENLERGVRRYTDDEVQSVLNLLSRRRLPATHRNVTELTGIKLEAFRQSCQPHNPTRLRHDEGRYWKLDGVSPLTKRAARLAALKEGEAVGPWVEKILQKALAGN